jgi:alpha-L-rhamnosidase
MLRTIAIFAVLEILTVLPLPAASAADGDSALTVIAMSCEYTASPLGVDTPRPRLAWTLDSNRRAIAQQAYQILVASSPERLAADTSDLWDSGKIVSDASIQVEYAGKPLTSGQQCFWKVRVGSRWPGWSVERYRDVDDGFACSARLAGQVDSGGYFP